MTTPFADEVQWWCGVTSRILGWTPPEFWRATPAELATALRDPFADPAATGPSREHIAQMMERDSHG